MTTADYLINLLFVLIVARQALDRRIDRRYFLIPIVLVFWVGSQYLHTLPTAGNDLVLVAALACVGLTRGTISGLATHIRRDRDGIAFARVGWLAGILLVAGISSRMVFAFAISHGLEPAVRSFSITNHISGAAWPVAMVAMALCALAARRPTSSHMPSRWGRTYRECSVPARLRCSPSAPPGGRFTLPAAHARRTASPDTAAVRSARTKPGRSRSTRCGSPASTPRETASSTGSARSSRTLTASR